MMMDRKLLCLNALRKEPTFGSSLPCKTETTMSKTNKINIKLKLSTHLQMKARQSLKQPKQNEIQNPQKKNLSMMIEEPKNEDQSPPQRSLSKSVYLPKTIQPKIKDVDNDHDENETLQREQDRVNDDEECHENHIGVYTDKSFPHVTHFKQPSVSDPDFAHLHSVSIGPEAVQDDQHDFIKDAPSHPRGSRTSSLSITIAEKMDQNIAGQMENGDDSSKQHIVTPAILSKSQQRASGMVQSKHSHEVKSECDVLINAELFQTSRLDVDDDEKEMKFDIPENDGEQQDQEDEDREEDVEEDNEEKEDREMSISLTASAPSTPSISSLSSSISSDMMNTTDIECILDLNEVFIVEKSIGRGKTAHVHYAVYKNECDIALKEFRFARLTNKILLDFYSELQTLKKLDHDNLCRLLGHYVDEKSKQLYLAFEWLPCGCLYDVIHDKNVSIEFVDVLEMSLDIARGMKYLHSQNIIHRDLKSHNLLLDEAYRVKITDFGSAKTLDKVSGTTYAEVGTCGYCAPEVIEQSLQGYDRKVDVFSYGVLLWEIFERGKVFDQQSLRNISKLKQGQRPNISVHCPHRFRQLINDCWQLDPCKRPNFTEIVDVLETLSAKMHQTES